MIFPGTANRIPSRQEINQASALYMLSDIEDNFSRIGDMLAETSPREWYADVIGRHLQLLEMCTRSPGHFVQNAYDIMGKTD